MTKAGAKIIEGAKEALAIARGELEPARVFNEVIINRVTRNRLGCWTIHWADRGGGLGGFLSLPKHLDMTPEVGMIARIWSIPYDNLREGKAYRVEIGGVTILNEWPVPVS